MWQNYDWHGKNVTGVTLGKSVTRVTKMWQNYDWCDKNVTGVTSD